MRTEEKKLRGEPDRIADWVILVEGYDGSEVAAARAELPTELSKHGAADGVASGLYTLDFTLGQEEAGQLWQKS
jgi:hypothetical protein